MKEHCLTFSMSFFRSCDIVFCVATVHLLLILSDKFKTKPAASLHEILSASRWIATRRLGSFLASGDATVSKHFSARKSKSRSETCILRQNETLTQNITTIESKFLRCEAQNTGVVVCTAGFRVRTRKCHGHDAVQMQAEDQAALDRPRLR